MNSVRNSRKSTRWTTLAVAALACFGLFLGGPAVLAVGLELGPDLAFGRDGGPRYTITITNLTYDQIISPPVVVVHDGRFDLFEAGEPASSELASLAEDGMTGPLVGLLQVSPGVADFAVATSGIMPGASVSVEVTPRGRARLLSLAGMLVSTNDGFAGVDGYVLSPFGSSTVYAEGWDAGSERNTENCDHIPGPPCGHPGVRVTDGAEGFVHVHRGVHGVGDPQNGFLDAASKDWRNPVARITIHKN